MAVTLNHANSPIFQNGTSGTLQCTVSAGTNIVAFAFVGLGPSGTSFASVTFNGIAMTPCGPLLGPGTGSAPYAQAFYLASPPVGNNIPLVVTPNATSQMYLGLTSFNGVSQTTPVRPGSYISTLGNATDVMSLTIPSNTSDMTVSLIDTGGNTIQNTNTNQTCDGTLETGSYGYGFDHCTTPASSVTHTWTLVAAVNRCVMLGFSIQGPSSGAAPVVFRLE